MERPWYWEGVLAYTYIYIYTHTGSAIMDLLKCGGRGRGRRFVLATGFPGSEHTWFERCCLDRQLPALLVIVFLSSSAEFLDALWVGGTSLVSDCLYSQKTAVVKAGRTYVCGNILN